MSLAKREPYAQERLLFCNYVGIDRRVEVNPFSLRFRDKKTLSRNSSASPTTRVRYSPETEWDFTSTDSEPTTPPNGQEFGSRKKNVSISFNERDQVIILM